MSSAESARVSDDVTAELRASIIAQRDKPGSTITETAVALRFGVARPTARMAIDRLVASGILRRETHKAARVPVLDAADVADLYASRVVIESAAMAALATSGTIPAEALDAHRALGSSDQLAAHDIAFHRALVAGQASTRLARMHELLLGEIELCIGQVHAAHLLTASDVTAQHQRILDAITAGDAEGASRLTREHIELSRDALLERIAHG